MSESHFRFDDHIEKYLSSELPDQEMQDLESHLNHCEDCVERLERHAKTYVLPYSCSKIDGINDSGDMKLTDSAEFFLRELKEKSPREVPQSIDHYRVLRLISSGGHGEVYECLDQKLNRRIALKTIRPQHLSGRSMQRFQNEARIQAKLSHENIVQLFGFGLSDSDIPYLVMELMEGGTLGHLIQNRPMAPRKAAMLMEKCARGVAYAHSEGVLHRDLKPSNILLSRIKETTKWLKKNGDDFNLDPKISDFGIAKLFDAGSRITASGAIVGTPNYMSPEQATGGIKSLTAQSDIYSMGVILYECLTGRPPFQSDQVSVTLRMIEENQPVSPRLIQLGIPRDLDTICLKCLEKEPRQRYKTADDLAEDLNRFIEGKPILARPVPAFQKLWRWCRRNPTLAASLSIASALLVVIAAGGLLFAHVQRDLLKQAKSIEKKAVFEANSAVKARLEAEFQRNLARDQFIESSRILFNIGNMLAIDNAKTEPARDLKEISLAFQKQLLNLSENYLRRADISDDSPDLLVMSIFNAARAHDELGHAKDAIRHYEWLLEMISDSRPSKETHESFRYLATNARLALSNLYTKQNETQKAISILEPFWTNQREPIESQRTKSEDEPNLQLRALFGSKLHSLYIRLNQLEKAKEIEQEILKIAGQLTNKP
jgi:serine/threonine-protein kinase